MSAETQRQLAAYKAQVDAKYAGLKGMTLEDATAGSRAEAEERRREDRWLLVDPASQIVGVMARWACKSAVEAFEEFYPKKRERLAAAAEGYRIEEDDAAGSRFEAWCAATKSADAAEVSK
jgi:hypothetical protein